jgi:predicted permease
MMAAIIPAACFVVAGYLLRRRLHLDLKPVSRVALYVFSPALVFSSLTSPGHLLRDVTGVLLFAAGMTVGALAISRGLGRAARLAPLDQAGMDLATMFPNSANLGLPIVTFGLGASSLRAAVLFVLTQIILINTVGAYVAGRVGVPPRLAIRRVAGLPAIWAALLAGIVVTAHVPVPPPLLTAARFGGDAYPPLVLVVLGGTLSQWHVGSRRGVTWIAIALRLLVMPVLAWGVARGLNLPSDTAAAVVLQTAMPVAVNTLVLAQEFSTIPETVGGIVGLSTMAAIVTVPFWLVAVARGL